MQIAVISDLHLGSGGPADLFGHDDGEFLRFLGHLEKNFEKIVLLGDVWEALTGPRWGSQAVELQAARAHHREIAERFRRPMYSYVHGNHDHVAKVTDGAPEELMLEADGVRLLFSHGHQGDPLITSTRWLSELGVWLGGWIRRLRLASVYAYFSHLDQERNGMGDDCLVRRWAVTEAAQRRADVIITGHTHIPARREDASCLFLNSGSCAEGQISFLSMDTRTGNYRICNAI